MILNLRKKQYGTIAHVGVIAGEFVLVCAVFATVLLLMVALN